MSTFYNFWKDYPVILDTWFSLEASAPRDSGLDTVKKLLNHKRFDPLAPNSLRAVLGGLVSNPLVFHNPDGTSYRFLANQIALIDKRNPIAASRFTKLFSRWNRYVNPYRNEMYKAIEILSQSSLSSNTLEVVDLLLK